MVDYKKIKLENERSTDITKRLNRNTGWGFFKILYRDHMLKLVGFSLLMLLFAAPILVAMYFGITAKTLELTTGLPSNNFLWVGNSVWLDVENFTQENIRNINTTGAIWMSVAALGLSVVFSGGFAVIRNSFWTGRFDVFKVFFKGIGQSIAYTLPGTAVLSGLCLLIYLVGQTLSMILPNWVYIIIMVVMWAVFVLVFTYMYTLFAVVVTYKQNFKQNIADAWRLMWLNFIPNLIRIAITAIPVVLYAILDSGSIIFTLLNTFMLLFGMFFFVYVYMVHMMRTFALFHPVQPAKK